MRVPELMHDLHEIARNNGGVYPVAHYLAPHDFAMVSHELGIPQASQFTLMKVLICRTEPPLTPKVDSVWMHYKGAVYRVIEHVTHAETSEIGIVYQLDNCPEGIKYFHTVTDFLKPGRFKCL
jgi:hypothetical protein